jgi:hypothetical protein
MNAVLSHLDWDNDMRTVWSGGSVVSGSNMQQFHAAVSRSSFARFSNKWGNKTGHEQD